MAEYRIPQEAARQIAVGLYRQVGDFVAAAKRSNLADYERYADDYLAKQATRSPAPGRHRHIRNSPVTSR